MNLKSLLKTVAPMLATAIAGPVGGLAVQVLGDALGIDEPTQEKIASAFTSGSLTGEQIVAVKSAEQAFVLRCRELDIDLERIHAADRGSARDLLKVTRARTPAALSWMVTIGNFGVMGYLLAYGNPADLDPLLLGRILGTLDIAFGTVLVFWLGTTHGSRTKDDTMADMAKR